MRCVRPRRWVCSAADARSRETVWLVDAVATSCYVQRVQRVITIGEIELFVREEGPPDGKPVLLLHGFPDSGELWRFQTPALAAAGYRVIVPDLRGFGRSSKPASAEAYALPLLVEDIVGLLDALEVERASLVAHDWGAFIAWVIAATTPNRVERLAAVSVGHPAGYYDAGIEQLEMSWYSLWFLAPGLAESALPANGWSLWRQFVRNAADTDRWIEHCESASGNLTAMLNIYRANVDPAAFGGGAPLELPPVTCPVMGIWSDQDHYCTEAQMTNSPHFCTGQWQYERIEHASHWIPVDQPDRVNELLLEFLPR
jgi:pimeloyl-ACP methyl ester carboxylesterase